MKIFNFGLPRTGTKSISKALEILGYKSWHYGIPDDLYIIDNVLLNYKVLNTYDDFGDMTICIY